MSSTPPEWTIPLLLAESARLGPTLPPVFSWESLCDYINRCDLGALRRHEDLEALYIGAFHPLVRAEYGTMENYLRGQLKWSAEEGEQERKKAVERGEGEWWKKNSVVNIRRNDWRYGVPAEVEHWVVWTPLPILTPERCEGTTTPWPKVDDLGVTGFTGGDGSLVGFGSGENGPGSEIEAFVKERWPEDKWETAWFVNPPRLQSVKGLAHFHVMTRPKKP
ncbi:hypothetical protein P7C70_g4076, partial [Phenoliferia sp. Uapishka_3]